MILPEHDQNFLKRRCLEYEVADDQGYVAVVIRGWKLPPGYTTTEADLLIRLAPGYPDVPPDMWWFEPAVVRTDGREIEATQVTEQRLNRAWQRWSRHLGPEQWNSGIDGLESYLTIVAADLEKHAQRQVAA